MFFSVENLSSTVVTPMEKPWEFSGLTVPPEVKTKDEFKRWVNDARTKSAFISGFEGITTELRVNEKTGNSPYRMHALIVDYDSPFAAEDEARLKAKTPPSEFLPAYWSRTFSGNLRLIWLFESPLPIITTEQARKLLVLLRHKLSLTKWYAGLDTGALGNPMQYYHIGRAWQPLYADKAIPKGHLRLWLHEASREISLDTTEEGERYKVPIEKIAAEVDAKFPGRWQGAFVVGARGLRFWDPDAKDQTAAVVCEEGMLYFTNGGGFKTWRQIFGPSFVEQFEADRISSILDKAAYDGREIWMQNTDGDTWTPWSKDDFAQELRVRGFDPARGKSTCSDIDKVENAVKKQCRVDRALPFFFKPTGIIVHEGKRILNITRVKPLVPAPPGTIGPMTFMDGKEKFPFIYGLLRTLFVEPDPDHPLVTNSEEEPQLENLLAWLKHFYESAHYQRPTAGLALVLVGVAGKGKTLFTRRIVGGLVGGFADASQHLAAGEQWTEHLADAPVMCVDDSLNSSNPNHLLQFSNMIKKYVANNEMQFNQKYKQTGRLPWYGRIAITANFDNISLRILPDMNMSTRDKISLFLASDNLVRFPERDVVDRKLAQELPEFARFLLDWTIPPNILRDNRFGLTPYHHPLLLQEALNQGESGIVIELLSQFLPMYKQGHPGLEGWIGPSTLLFQDLTLVNQGVMAKMQPRSLATSLGILKSRGFNIRKDENSRDWFIAFTLKGDGAVIPERFKTKGERK